MLQQTLALNTIKQNAINKRNNKKQCNNNKHNNKKNVTTKCDNKKTQPNKSQQHKKYYYRRSCIFRTSRANKPLRFDQQKSLVTDQKN